MGARPFVVLVVVSLLVGLLAVGGARPVAADPPAPPRAAGEVQVLPSAGLQVRAVVSDAAGNGWFVSGSGTSSGAPASIGKVTPGGDVTLFEDPGITPVDLALGGDGNLWFTSSFPVSVGRITPAGVVTTFTSPDVVSSIGAITTGADGSLWFLHGSSIGRITTAGVITTFAPSSPSFVPQTIATTTDGSVWFAGAYTVNPNTGLTVGWVDRVTPAGQVVLVHSGIGIGPMSLQPASADEVWVAGGATSFVRLATDGTTTPAAVGPSPNVVPTLLAVAPDALWYSSRDGLGRIAAGADTRVPLIGLAAATNMAPRPDGSFWLVDGLPNGSIVIVRADGSMARIAGPGIVSPGQLAVGPDGNVWFTNADAVGRMTPTGEVAVFAEGQVFPSDITSGPNGHLWFTSYDPAEADGAVVELTTSGVVVATHPVTGHPTSITAGPDGNLWLVTASGVTRLTPTGVATTFAEPVLVDGREIIAGPDGNLWLAGGAGVTRITSAGVLTHVTFESSDALTVGPDGNVWWVAHGGSTVSTIAPSGAITTFGLLTFFHWIEGDRAPALATGPDGNLWYAPGHVFEHERSVWRITPTGVVTELTDDAPHLEGLYDATGLIAGPGDAMWFAGWPNRIGSIGTGLYAPPAPQVFDVWAQPGAAFVAWGTADNGSAPATSYTVTASPGGARCTVVVAPEAQLGCTVSALTNGVTYTFTVTATNASGTGAASPPSPAATPMFADVPTSAPFRDDIAWLAANGIATGNADGTYRPTSPVSRRAMAAFLYRLAGSPWGLHPSCAPVFADVPLDAPLCGEIEWLLDRGVTQVPSGGAFRPGAPVARQAMAAFLYRLAGSPGGPTPSCPEAPYTDVPIGAPFCGEIAWLKTTGITTGYPGGTFHPVDSVSRQAMAAFLHRFHDLP